MCARRGRGERDMRARTDPCCRACIFYGFFILFFLFWGFLFPSSFFSLGFFSL
jgi:hypothetical protein